MQDDSIAVALLAVLANQSTRWRAALEDLPADLLTRPPGGDCRPILAMGQHLIDLRRFQLLLLQEPTDLIPASDGLSTLDELVAGLATADAQVVAAVERHDPADWLRTPDAPRPGPWKEEPTLSRFVRPLNDYATHIGAIRAVRRIAADPIARVQ